VIWQLFLLFYLIRYFFSIFALFPIIDNNPEKQKMTSFIKENGVIVAKRKSAEKQVNNKFALIKKYKKIDNLKENQKRKPISLASKPGLEAARLFRRKKMVKVKIYFNDTGEKAYHKMTSFITSFNHKYTFVQLEPFPIIFCELSPSQIENLKLDFQIEE
jgi:hypothetical protein